MKFSNVTITPDNVVVLLGENGAYYEIQNDNNGKLIVVLSQYTGPTKE